MPDKTYNCNICKSKSIVSDNYMEFDYVKANCCSVCCYNKKCGTTGTMENTQDGTFELKI